VREFEARATSIAALGRRRSGFDSRPSPSPPGAARLAMEPEPTGEGEGALDRSVSSMSTSDEPVGMVAEIDAAMNELALTEQERAQVVSEGVTTVQELRRIAAFAGWTERATRRDVAVADVAAAQAALDAFVAEHGSDAESWSLAWDSVALSLLSCCKRYHYCGQHGGQGEACIPPHLRSLATDPTREELELAVHLALHATVFVPFVITTLPCYFCCDSPGSQPRRHALENALWEAELKADAEKAMREAHARITDHRERHNSPFSCEKPLCSDMTLGCCTCCWAGCSSAWLYAIVAAIPADIQSSSLAGFVAWAGFVGQHVAMCAMFVPCVMCVGWLAPIDNRRRHFQRATQRANKRVSDRRAAAASLARGEFDIPLFWIAPSLPPPPPFALSLALSLSQSLPFGAARIFSTCLGSFSCENVNDQEGAASPLEPPRTI
jgi:hypothetical protein